MNTDRIGTYDRVVRTSETKRFERQEPAFGRCSNPMRAFVRADRRAEIGARSIRRNKIVPRMFDQPPAIREVSFRTKMPKLSTGWKSKIETLLQTKRLLGRAKYGPSAL